MKGRNIIENLQLNWDVMSYASTNKIQAATIVDDQEKALIFSLKPYIISDTDPK